jgi:sugar phosphate isomerase/epimerase
MYNLTARGHDLTDAHTPEALATKMQAVNIHNVQLALGMSFPELPSDKNSMNPGMGTYVKNALAKRDVQVAILSCYINMIHPDLAVREELLEKFEAYVRYAKFFGASLVASETGNVYPEIHYTEENFTDEPFFELVKVIKRLVAAGEKHKMMVGIEPGLNHPLYSLGRVRQLIQAIDSEYLGIVFDPSNLITADNYKTQVDIVKEAFETFGEKIVAVHLKDYRVVDGKIIPCNFGEGVIKYQEILDIVYKYRPYCYVVLEETKDEGLLKADQVLNQ